MNNNNNNNKVQWIKWQLWLQFKINFPLSIIYGHLYQFPYMATRARIEREKGTLISGNEHNTHYSHTIIYDVRFHLLLYWNEYANIIKASDQIQNKHKCNNKLNWEKSLEVHVNVGVCIRYVNLYDLYHLMNSFYWNVMLSLHLEAILNLKELFFAPSLYLDSLELQR